MNRDGILFWLIEERGEGLWCTDGRTCRNRVGEAACICGLIEFSNCCRSNFKYYGMRSGRKSVR